MNNLKLRYYQRAAIDAVYSHLETVGTNPVIEIPTGGGKSPVIAVMAAELARGGLRGLILAHRKELLVQAKEKLQAWAPEISFGVYSAGLEEKTLDSKITIAGIQSIYKKGIKLSEYGNIDFIIVDEAHLIPPSQDEEKGMFRRLIQDLKNCNPNSFVIGLTATPYRLSSGLICSSKNILNKIVYRASIKELILGGYLSPLTTKAPREEIDFSTLSIVHGEFKTAEVDDLIAIPKVVFNAVREILTYTKNRKKTLVFCSSIKHATLVFQELKKYCNDKVALITGETPSPERNEIIKRFKNETVYSDLFENKKSELNYLVNVDVLTTGFDAPNIDCVCLLRPTASPGLYYQMVGRGFRKFPQKENCLILDFGGNIKRHGPVDEIQIRKKGERNKSKQNKAKTCPVCFSLCPPDAENCQNCNFFFNPNRHGFMVCISCKEEIPSNSFFCNYCGAKIPIASPSHNEKSETSLEILSGSDLPVLEEDVTEEFATKFISKKENAEPCVQYFYCTKNVKLCEFLTFNGDTHDWRTRKAVKWWKNRTNYLPIPDSIDKFFYLLEKNIFAPAEKIKYTPARGYQKYPKLIEVTYGEKPDLSTIITINENEPVCGNCLYFKSEGENIFCRFNHNSTTINSSCEFFTLYNSEIPF